MHALIYALIIICSFVGFLISAYVFHTKRKKEVMVCPLNFECDAVIYSPYSKFLGIPLEYLGMAYYALIGLSYIFILANPTAVPLVYTAFILTGITIMGFLFSLYLTFIQAFNLRQWCTWCLFSATMSTTIFIAVFVNNPFVQTPLIGFLSDFKPFILGLHMLGMALGLGGATISDILFFKFLKDLKISKEESDILHILSQIIWFGLGLIILSGVGLFLPNSEGYLASSKFISKVIIFAIIVANGIALNLLIAPKLVRISFGKKHDHEGGELHHLRRLAFALGATSLVSWYSVFVLGNIRSLSFGVGDIFLFYIFILFIAVMASQFLERYLSQKPMK